MTHEQNKTSAQLPGIDDTVTSFDDKQHVPFEKTIMSSHGPFERVYPSSRRLSGDWIMRVGDEDESDAEIDIPHPRYNDSAEQSLNLANETSLYQKPSRPAKVAFYDFAVQDRLQRYHGRRQRFLTSRRRTLHRSIALSARLQRTGAWVEDGLVEISRHNDTTSFQRVFTYFQDLIDVCHSHWNHDIQTFDTLPSSDSSATAPSRMKPFYLLLPSQHQVTLLELLNTLRSNPQFLTDRFRSLSRSQVATLTAKPRWQASEDFFTSFSQDSAGQSQRRRRLQAYSKELEDYATSFERSNPLAFLLFNVYGQDAAPGSSESQLRLYTWSRVCANLLECEAESYKSLYGQLFEAFSTAYDWPAKRRVELFLMDVLQRGAFLIDENISQSRKFGINSLKTEQAHEFFQNAVESLYWILIESGTGCYPTGALALARGVLGLLTRERDQMDFRGHFSSWYLSHFLQAAITFPENEDMLLKVHISKHAREYILCPLFNRFADKIHNPQDHTLPSDETIHSIYADMINMLDGEVIRNPYEVPSASKVPQPHDNLNDVSLDARGNMIVICASEVVKMWQSLTPQANYSSGGLDPAMRPVMRMLRHAFDNDAPRAQTRYDILKQALLRLVEPGTSASALHPCSESWTELDISGTGIVDFTSVDDQDRQNELWNDIQLSEPQHAALRLSRGTPESDELDETNLITHWSASSTLTELFSQQVDRCQAEARTLDCVYWRKMLLQLHRQYPFSNPKLTGDDTKVLSQPFHHARQKKEDYIHRCCCLEADLDALEKSYQRVKRLTKQLTTELDSLRFKLWYASEVVNSNVYLDARNVASALNIMNPQTVRMTATTNLSSRGTDQASSIGSVIPLLFGQEKDQTMDLLKAPIEHGGPRKLSDSQIEAVQRWLTGNNVDNFCPGEERLHRFCMQIDLAARRLTGERMVESPHLWSSELFSRERSSYDAQFSGVSSAPTSTRPASVMSDSLSGTYPIGRSFNRSNDSDTRSIVSDDRSSARRGSIHNLFYRTLNPQILTPELASSMSSYGRASTTTTTASDIFSMPSRSVTSASVYSRPPSIMYNDYRGSTHRPNPSLREKTKFLERLRRGVLCLLLSDLGCLVWSWGCETDAWIGKVQASSVIASRLDKRLAAEKLSRSSQRPSLEGMRRRSTQGGSTSRSNTGFLDVFSNLESQPQREDNDIEYTIALRDVLDRISHHIDPCEKLQACREFTVLAAEQYQASKRSGQGRSTVSKSDEETARRRSLDQARPARDVLLPSSRGRVPSSSNDKPSNADLHRHIKQQLAVLKPRTIFRDLQYVSALTPKEMLDDTAAGSAFVDLGMAAVDYKRELCRTMVDVADQMMVTNRIERKTIKSTVDVRPESSLSKAAEYWRIAAVEDNAVAMRELAGLYLVHPAVLPVVTPAMVLSSKIFQDDKMRQRKAGNEGDQQALCLALYWMQQAANKGDKIASQKLREMEISHFTGATKSSEGQ